MKLLVIGMALMLLGMGLPGQTSDEKAIEQVVRDSNRLEMAAYADPPNEELFKQLKETLVVDGTRYKDAISRIERARKAGRKILNGTHTIDKLEITELLDKTATVETRETGGFEWSDNASPPFRQNQRRHIYTLKKNDAGKWLIDDEVMDPPPGQ